MDHKKLTNRDWETSAFAGLMFSLDRYKDRLTLNRAYKLSAKPREIDVIIIDQKKDDGHIDHAIGGLFEKYNLIELKNPYEALNIDVIWKGISYAAQYKSKGYDEVSGRKGIDVIQMENVTLTFIRVSKPEKLFNDLRMKGYAVDEKHPGVYYISGMADIRMQVVVGTELDGEEYLPFKVQKVGADENDVRRFIRFADSLHDESDREMADAIMQISISENKELYSRLKEDDEEMCRALEELMADKIEERVNERVNASLVADREDRARRMIRKKRPLGEIMEFTDVGESRISELAESIGVDLVTN